MTSPAPGTGLELGASSAEPFAELKRRSTSAILAARAEILELSHLIHANPEPAFEERLAATWIAGALAQRGYDVEHPAGSLETAVRGRLAGGRGRDGPRIGILAEYDALPGLGHGCGHNTMAASAVAAAIGLAAVRDALPGEIVFLGTPAEERGSGKQVMIDDGLFAGIDAALLYHPSSATHVECHMLACEDVDVTFTGRPAHAAAYPWDGLNALDAMVMLLNGIALWRQQLRPDSRVHGIVLDGGMAANIIPARTTGRFMIRTAHQASFGEMRTRFAALVEAAAAATGCEGEVVFSGGSSTMLHNRTLGERFAAQMAAHGLADAPPGPTPGSSDLGNVSQILPTIHPHIAICETEVPWHSVGFREAALTDRADEVTLLAGILVAETAIELFCDPRLVDAAWREYRERSA